MDTAARDTRFLDADTFLRTDQSEFGNAWRYELVRGTIIAHAAPSPEHGVILGNLAAELHGRLRGHHECRPEVGSGAAAQYERRDTACIPDAMVRCGEHPRVIFEVVSPSELQHKRQWDQRRADLQAVEGVMEIVEIFQDEMLAHVYRRQDAGWMFESTAGSSAELVLPSVGISVPLAALYERVGPEEERDVEREELGVLARCPAVPRRLLTVDEYHRMGEAGILTEDDRVELIEGELVEIAPIGSGHVAATNALNRLLVMAVGDRGIVSAQNPVRLTQRSEPQPDFAVLRQRDYRTALPRAEDTMLAVEVASSSLDYDRKVKLALYARAGIPEVWIVNLSAREVEIYKSPLGDSYTAMSRAVRADSLTIAALPDVRIPVADIFS